MIKNLILERPQTLLKITIKSKTPCTTILGAKTLVFVVIQFGQSVVQQERAGFSMNFSSVVLFGRFFQLVKWQFWPEISIFGGSPVHVQFKNYAVRYDIKEPMPVETRATSLTFQLRQEIDLRGKR